MGLILVWSIMLLGLFLKDNVTFSHRFPFSRVSSIYLKCCVKGDKLLFCFILSPSLVFAWVIEPACLRLNQAGATEHRRTYITLPSLPPLPPALNQGPPILRPSLSDSAPHSLSPPSFSLTESPTALSAESSAADAFSPTCPYLQKKARGRNIPSLFLWIFASPLQDTIPSPLFGSVLVAPWFSLWNINDYNSFSWATSCPAAFCQKVSQSQALQEWSLVGWMDCLTFDSGLVLEETSHHRLLEICQVGCNWNWDHTWRIRAGVREFSYLFL